MSQLQEIGELWQREAGDAAGLRASLAEVSSALAGAQGQASTCDTLLHSLSLVHRASSLDDMCLVVTQQFCKVFRAGRVTLFILQRPPVGVDFDLANGAGDGSAVWTTVNAIGERFTVPLGSGPVVRMLESSEVVTLSRPDAIARYMESMQRTQYQEREVHHVMACPLRSSSNEVVGFLEALNPESGAGFPDSDRSLMAVAAAHVGQAVAQYVRMDMYLCLYICVCVWHEARHCPDKSERGCDAC